MHVNMKRNDGAGCDSMPVAKVVSMSLVILFALASFHSAPTAVAGVGCSNSSLSYSTSCSFSCDPGDYLRIKAENTNGGYVRGSMGCADQSAACGAYGSCVVTTNPTTSGQLSTYCQAERDNLWGSVKVACQAKAHPSHFTISSAVGVKEVVITMVGEVAAAQRCSGPSEDALTCIPVTPTCQVDLGRMACWVGAE